MSQGQVASTLTHAEEAWAALSAVLKDGASKASPEAAMSCITACTVALLGDKTAHLRPGGLKNGETQYSVAAAVMISPDRQHNIFIAQQNFPEDQFRLGIAIDHGHPGRVVKNEKSLILANTDEHEDFAQILSTSRMGSSIYAPFFWGDVMLGQLICGAQARNTYRPLDLELLEAFSHVAAMLWVAHDGPAQLSGLMGSGIMTP